MSDDQVVIAEWPRNSRDVIRVSLSRFRNFATLDIREWYPDHGQFRPGRKGISIPLAAVPRLAKALEEGLRLAEPRGGKEAGR